jgi:pyruvate,water dikinase
MKQYIKHFKDTGINDIASVGGKNASLGEMISKLSTAGIPVPNGFAVTSEAFLTFLTHNSLQEKLKDLMQQLDKKNYLNLRELGAKARKLLMEAEIPKDLQKAILDAYKTLCGGKYFEVAVSG